MSEQNELQEAINATKNYKSYLEKLSCDPLDKTRAYHLSLEDIKQLAEQNNAELDGVRIYLGQHILPNGEQVFRTYIVGTVQQNGTSVDVGVNEGLFATKQPCPPSCNDDENNPLYP